LGSSNVGKTTKKQTVKLTIKEFLNVVFTN